MTRKKARVFALRQNVAGFVFNCQNPDQMTKKDFMSRQLAAERRLKDRNKFMPWVCFMVLISMVLAIPYLIALLCFSIFKGYFAYQLLWEIGFCVLCACIARYLLWRTQREAVAFLRELGLRCQVCDKSPIFEKGKITATTGRCWNCGERFFDPDV